MKFVVVLLFAVLVVATAQRRRFLYPRLPFFPPSENVYAASLGGAPVGLYSRNGGRGGFGGQGPDVYGASLGGAPVGMYARESPRFRYPLLG